MAYDEVGAGDPVNVEPINFNIQRQVNRPVCRLVLPSNQAIAASTPTLILFGSSSETMDDLGWHDTSVNTSRITPKYAGRYAVKGWCTFTANTTGSRRLQIYKNGVGYGGFHQKQADSAGPAQCDVWDVVEADGVSDYFELNAFQASGVSLNLLGAGDASSSCGFIMAFLGEDT